MVFEKRIPGTIINDKMVMLYEEARQTAQELQEGDPDWRYTVVLCEDDPTLASIAVYDERGNQAGWW